MDNEKKNNEIQEELSLDSTYETEFTEETKANSVVTEEIDEEIGGFGDLYNETEQKITSQYVKEVDESVDTLADDYVEYQKKTTNTDLTVQLEEDLGNLDLGTAEELSRQAEKDKMIDEEAEVRAEEKAQVIVTQTIRSATEVLNEQNLIATKEAEQSIAERQYRLEQKRKKNKRRDLRNRVGTIVFTAILVLGMYICYVNPTLNQGIRSVISKTFIMFSDLIEGKDVKSNEVIDSLGDELNERTMKYEQVMVDEKGNILEEAD